MRRLRKGLQVSALFRRFYCNPLATAINQKNYLEVTWKDGTQGKYHNVWLRDNCTCSECFSPSFQRECDTARIDPQIRPSAVELSPHNEIRLSWEGNDNTASHTSVYSSTFLRRKIKPKHQPLLHKSTKSRKLATNLEIVHSDRIPHEILWDKAQLEKEIAEGWFISPSFHDLHNKSVQDQMMRILHLYGFVVIKDSPPSIEASRKVHEWSGMALYDSFFGKDWQLAVDSALSPEEALKRCSFGDSAYFAVGLGLHSDGTYEHESPATQIFHVTEHTGEGGDTTLADGFFLAHQLRRKFPDTFEYLQRRDIRAIYKDPDNYRETKQPVITTSSSDEEILQMIRFNNSDRNDFIPHDEADEFYTHYGRFLKMTQQPEHIFTWKLRPDELLLTNNWRVLHGRKKFSGLRRMCGLYMSRASFVERVNATQF
eukprot:TRINITY_DN6090_c0_g2_i1.p1 TRINITY_DN6090_c0_g2~~TRINITY_DN6090_c0_g2_i1.p1  ORF type:complete len:428 (+),score=68.42 TRINITY_DN6090_c0_g2_i1:47-1330(+)